MYGSRFWRFPGKDVDKNAIDVYLKGFRDRPPEMKFSDPH